MSYGQTFQRYSLHRIKLMPNPLKTIMPAVHCQAEELLCVSLTN